MGKLQATRNDLAARASRAMSIGEVSKASRGLYDPDEPGKTLDASIWVRKTRK